MLDVDLSYKEKILERSNKQKGLVVKTHSSSKYMSPMGTAPSWLKKDVMVRHKRKLYCSVNEGTRELVEALKKPELPMHDAQTLAFITRNQN